MLFAVCLTCATPAEAAPHDADLAYFHAAYKAMDTANSRENAPGAAAYCAPDYVIVSSTGKKLVDGKAEALKQLASTFQYLSYVTDTTTIDKCVFSTDGAEITVTTDTYFTFTMNSKSSPDHNRNVRSELWVKTPAGWQVKRTQTLASHDYSIGKNLE